MARDEPPGAAHESAALRLAALSLGPAGARPGNESLWGAENELEYADVDHRIAHGHAPLRTASGRELTSLQRARTVTLDTAAIPGPETTALPPPTRTERHWHRRRASHDEKPGSARKFLIDVEETKAQILAQEDTDGDFQITVHDSGPKTFTLGTAGSFGFRKFDVRGTYMLSNLLQELALASEYGRKHIVLDETRLNENPVDRMTRLIKYHFWDGLTRRTDGHGISVLCQDPKDRSAQKRPRIYVPYYDARGLEYYREIAQTRPALDLDVVRLPEIITPQYVKSINQRMGLLALALQRHVGPTGVAELRGVPFVVPGGRFNEMYGWDSYFETLGLLVDGRVELARSMVENFLYQIEHYGKILNANRSYYLCRTQPPFLTDMCLQVHTALERTGKPQYTRAALYPWLARCARAAIKELLGVWLAAPRLDAIGLVKYYPEGIGMPPETESTHFNHILEPFARRHGVSVEEFKVLYDEERVREPELDAYFVHDRAVRESGHDTTYRFEGKCAQLATVDLNALLFRYATEVGGMISVYCGGRLRVRLRRGPGGAYERAFRTWLSSLESAGSVAAILGGPQHGWDSGWARGLIVLDEAFEGYDLERGALLHGNGGSNTPESAELVTVIDEKDPEAITLEFTPALFSQIAARIRALANEFLYSPRDGLFYDYDTVEREQSVYETVTCLWTLWAGLCTPEQASRLARRALARFEVTGGLVSGTEESRGQIGLDRPSRQWDWPYGWAPHQMLAWVGLSSYGFRAEATRVAYRWLYTITKSFVDFNGVVPEKFDVVTMSHKVNVEYGNVGTDFRYINREGFGWMNASFEFGLQFLTSQMRRALGALTPPDQLFSRGVASGGG